MLLTVVYGVLVIGAVCLVALAGLELVQRLVPADSRSPHNDVAGFIYAALGVIYAVLLALVVIAVWEEYNAASETVEQEANALAEIFWLAHRLPEPEGVELQELARGYAEEVVHTEWPLMEQGEAPLMTQVEETPGGVDPYRRYPSYRTGDRAPHTGRRAALRRRTRPGPEAGRRKKVAPGRGRGGRPRGVVVRADLRWDGGGGLHLPVWSGEHVGPQAYGTDPGRSYRACAIHDRSDGASLLRRGEDRDGSLRAGTGEIRDQQAKRPLKARYGSCLP